MFSHSSTTSRIIWPEFTCPVALNNCRQETPEVFYYGYLWGMRVAVILVQSKDVKNSRAWIKIKKFQTEYCCV
ncbi:hypothetical protein POPTR_014G081150v4 [Populus trichocarpa]|uniref:Uncharacterized protein n=1 Tax=Populus trichocarpa TaxID=3694 RepID=A0A3N7FY76_POPTR|nr:hypothetical protein POPTR_014G081150v4 [Populus trichocarpa]